MKTIEIKLYKFEELTEEAQKKAIEREQNAAYEYIFLDFFQESCIEQIKETGFYDNVQLSYSLSYCQGDGLSFSANRVSHDLLTKLFTQILGPNKEKTIQILIDNSSFQLKGNNGHYCYAHENQLSFELDNYRNYNDNAVKIVEQVESELKSIYVDLCENLENQGYKEIEYQQSEEYCKETLICNDYDFTENGEIY